MNLHTEQMKWMDEVSDRMSGYILEEGLRGDYN